MSLRCRPTLAAGLLCAVAASVALWSGPLTAVSGALHSGSATTVHAQVASSHDAHVAR